MHDFELHEFFHSPKNVLLKALLYQKIRNFQFLITEIQIIPELDKIAC